jgi:hypothetical protein
MNAVTGLFSLILLVAFDAPAISETASPPPQDVRLNLSIRLHFDDLQHDAALGNSNRAGLEAGTKPAPLSRTQLFQSGDLSAALGNDGKIHYRLPSPSFLGTKLTGQLNTNSARLSLTWPPKD